MFKKMLISSSLIASTFGIGFQYLPKNMENFQYNITRIVFRNNKENNFTDTDDLVRRDGQNFSTIYRIYMDSTGNKNLPPINNANDYNIGKGAKDEWREHLVNGLKLNVADLSYNKSTFLQKFKSVIVTYGNAYNFWNGVKGWTDKLGVSIPAQVQSYSFAITDSNYTKELWTKTDDSHSSNEKARLIMEQKWNGNILTINWKLGVWYHWASGSIYNHASFNSFTEDQYTFSKLDVDDDKVNSTSIDELSTLTLTDKKQVSGIKNLNDHLSNFGKNNHLKKDSLIVGTTYQSYIGLIQIGTITNIIFVILYWEVTSYFSIDNALILVGEDMGRTLTVNIKSNNVNLTYENDLKFKDETNSQQIASIFKNSTLTGVIGTSFLYIKM